MAFILLLGGLRYSHAADTPSDAAVRPWNQGQYMQLNSSGNMTPVTDQNQVLGPAFDAKNATDNDVKGSGKVTVVVGTFIAENDQVASGINPGINDLLYVDSTGKITNVAQGKVIGKTITAEDSDGFLRYYGNVEY